MFAWMLSIAIAAVIVVFGVLSMIAAYWTWDAEYKARMRQREMRRRGWRMEYRTRRPDSNHESQSTGEDNAGMRHIEMTRLARELHEPAEVV